MSEPVPGLIYSKQYSATKDELCAKFPSVEQAFNAAEWPVEDAINFTSFELIKETPRGVVRAHAVPPSENTPGLVVTFTFEHHQDEMKVLMLDAKLDGLPDAL